MVKFEDDSMRKIKVSNLERLEANAAKSKLGQARSGNAGHLSDGVGAKPGQAKTSSSNTVDKMSGACATTVASKLQKCGAAPIVNQTTEKPPMKQLKLHVGSAGQPSSGESTVPLASTAGSTKELAAKTLKAARVRRSSSASAASAEKSTEPPAKRFRASGKFVPRAKATKSRTPYDTEDTSKSLKVQSPEVSAPSDRDVGIANVTLGASQTSQVHGPSATAPAPAEKPKKPLMNRSRSLSKLQSSEQSPEAAAASVGTTDKAAAASPGTTKKARKVKKSRISDLDAATGAGSPEAPDQLHSTAGETESKLRVGAEVEFRGLNGCKIAEVLDDGYIRVEVPELGRYRAGPGKWSLKAVEPELDNEFQEEGIPKLSRRALRVQLSGAGA